MIEQLHGNERLYDALQLQLALIQAADILQRLKLDSDTLIVALTAYAMKGDKEKFIEAGCDAYLSKPVNTRELPGVIAEMLRQRQKDNP